MAGSGGVFKRGGQWWIRYSVGGRQYREPAHTTQKDLALTLLKKRQTEVFESRFFPDKRRGELSIVDHKERWLKYAETKGRKVTRHDGARFDTIANYFGPYRRISSLTRGDVEDFMAHLRAHKLANGSPLAPATCNRYLALLRGALNYAVEHPWGY